MNKTIIIINYLNLLLATLLILRAILANIDNLESYSRYFVSYSGFDLLHLTLVVFIVATVTNLLKKKWPKVYFVTLAMLFVPLLIMSILIGFIPGFLGFRS